MFRPEELQALDEAGSHSGDVMQFVPLVARPRCISRGLTSWRPIRAEPSHSRSSSPRSARAFPRLIRRRTPWRARASRSSASPGWMARRRSSSRTCRTTRITPGGSRRTAARAGGAPGRTQPASFVAPSPRIANRLERPLRVRGGNIRTAPDPGGGEKAPSPCPNGRVCTFPTRRPGRVRSRTSAM